MSTEAKEKVKLSVWEMMMWFKCGKTQVYNTLKKRMNNERVAARKGSNEEGGEGNRQ
jgi:plasmid replication initiation protein